MNAPRDPAARRRAPLVLALTSAVALIVALALWRSPARSAARPAGQPALAANPAAAASAAKSAAEAAACDVPSTTPANRFADSVAARDARIAALAHATAFDNWLTDWRRVDLAAQPALAARGRALAVARRAALKSLIETDPQRALALAVPVGLRGELPAEVQALLENRVDDRGALEVSVSHLNGAARYERLAVVDGQTYRAFVFGRRESQQTKTGLPLHGIAIDDVIALAETPYRLLDDTEKSARAGEAAGTAFVVGRRLAVAATPAEFADVGARLAAAESTPGPFVAEVFSGAPGNSATPATEAVTSPPSWITGTKRALFLKIDFADDTGAAFTDTEIQSGGAATTDYYTANGQTKTTFAFSIIPTVLRMPKTKAYYEASQSLNGELYAAARDAAQTYDKANGNTGAWDPDKFDRYLIVHKRMATYLYGGVAQLGGPRVGLNNAINGVTIGHELGHTQSLDHSHFWLPSGATAVGAGSHIEYGDVFDVMGAGATTQHFNASQKFKLGYLDATSVTTVTTAGTYRINRHDDLAAAGLRALKIAPADLGYEYWVEHRRVAPTSFNAAQSDRLRNGVLLHWGVGKAPSFTSGAGTYLLDATPTSAGGANDAPLRIGESFVDPDAGVTIKPLAVGGTAPTEYIDVQVAFGAIDGNRNPVLSAALPAGPYTARSNIIFNASATDADSDPVYYRWDFGDGSFQPNLPSITRRFTKGGAYTLRVSAHDGKGGIDAKVFPITVADPLTNWTLRPTGLTNTLYAATYAAGKFVVVGDNGAAVTSTDGTTWTRGTGTPNTHFYRGIASNGARFVAAGLAATTLTTRATAGYSDNGTTWSVATVPANVGQVLAVAYGAGRFVAVGETGRIYNSLDGSAWTEVTSPVTNTLRAVEFADRLFVAGGDSGRVLTSTDGITWTNRSVSTGNTLGAIARHKGAWYASSATQEAWTSSDGAVWTRIGTAGRTNNTSRMVSTSGVLLTSTSNGSIALTEDPRSWAQHQIDTTAGTTLNGLAEGGGQIIVVGPRGLIYSTTTSTSTPVLPAPALRLDADSIKVAVGRKNVLAASGAGFVKLELYANGTKVSELTGSAGALSWTPPSVGNYLLTVRGIDATGASVVSAAYPAVAAFANWKWLNPSPVASDLRGAVRVAGKWWIVGGGGTLVTLDDGGNFSPVDFATTQQLNSIAYANGRFVICTTDIDGGTKEDIGGLWTSPDGYAWTPYLTGVLDSANLNTALYAFDRWIAFGTGGTIVTSTDGINWPRGVSGVTFSLNGAAFGAGLVVAVGNGGTVITSADGATWTPRTSGVTTDLRGVTFANGTFVAAGFSGVILTSTDGITWTRPTSGTTQNLYSAAFVKGAFVVGGDSGTLLTSTNGAAWTAVSLNNNTSGTFYLSGDAGEGLLVGRSGEVYAANSATSWRRLTTGTPAANQAVLYANNRFVAVGSTSDPITRATLTPIQSSTDGITWTRAAANSAFAPLTAVTYGQSRYVAVGPNVTFTSTDATTWTRGPFANTTAFSCVTAGPAAFVAGSSGSTLYSSPDGSAWTSRTFGTTFPIRGAAYGATRFVIVGDTGNIRTSPDGTTWTAATSGVTTNLLAISYWDDVGFIAVGSTGTILNSPDGLAWTQRESGVAESLAAITRSSIGFVASGGVQGTMLISLDGNSWSLSALPLDKTVRGLAASANALVAVGDSGAMLAFELVDSTPAPTVILPPIARSVQAGESVTFSVAAKNTAGAVFQWSKDGAPIFGATTPAYVIPAATAAQAGSYTVTITTATGTVTSTAALAVSTTPIVNTNPPRLINLSIVTTLAAGEGSFSMGTVLGGAGTSGTKALLARAAGPSLAAFGVPGTLPDPKMSLLGAGNLTLATNDNWGGDPVLSNAFASVGAFAYANATTKDAALFQPALPGGNYAVVVSDTATGTGSVIAELYDATPAAAFTATTPRLMNVSIIKNIGAGLAAGFVIGGSGSKTVLIRAVGPSLTAFGLPAAALLADPKIDLIDATSKVIATNDNWGGTAALTAAFTQVGAFQLANTASKDAALLATLPPGNYSVSVSGLGGTSGIALVEVYDVP